MIGVDIVLNILDDFRKQFLDMEFESHENLRQLNLAMKHAVNKIMPCTVNEYIGDNHIGIWITFGEKSKNWSVVSGQAFWIKNGQ